MAEHAVKMSIIVFSGTVDKLMAVPTLATGAAAMGQEVDLLLTFWGLNAFRKDQIESNMTFSADFAEFTEPAMQAMRAKGMMRWMDVHHGAAEIGTVNVKARGMTMERFGWTPDDLDPIVEAVTGVASFVEEAKAASINLIIQATAIRPRPARRGRSMSMSRPADKTSGSATTKSCSSTGSTGASSREASSDPAAPRHGGRRVVGARRAASVARTIGEGADPREGERRMANLSAICVYCGSNAGARPAYAAAARAAGEFFAANRIRLIYGGGSVGLMGIVASAAMAARGEVIGVIPRALDRLEIGRRDITELRIVESMHERKALMNELADGFIALPGGFGTLEELCEMLTWAQLGIHSKPVGLLDVADFYAPFLALLDQAVAERFLHPAHRALLLHSSEIGELVEQMRRYVPPATTKWLQPDQG